MKVKCEAGCSRYEGGEVHHRKDCIFYPESMSQTYDDMFEALGAIENQQSSPLCSEIARAAIAKAKSPNA